MWKKTGRKIIKNIGWRKDGTVDKKIDGKTSKNTKERVIVAII